MKSLVKRMFTFLKNSMFNYSFCSFRYRVANIVHSFIDTLMMMKSSTILHLEVVRFTVEVSMNVSAGSLIRECGVDSPMMMEAHAA